MGIWICLSQLLGRASQRAAIPGACLQAQHSIINTMRYWCLPMGWVSKWAGHWLAFPLVFASSVFLQFWVKSLVGGLVFPSFHWGSCVATAGGFFRWDTLLGISDKVTCMVGDILGSPRNPGWWRLQSWFCSWRSFPCCWTQIFLPHFLLLWQIILTKATLRERKFSWLKIPSYSLSLKTSQGDRN